MSNTNYHFVAYEPRGFANEASVLVFETAAQKVAFEKVLFDGITYPGALNISNTKQGRAMISEREIDMIEWGEPDAYDLAMDANLIPDSYLGGLVAA